MRNGVRRAAGLAAATGGVLLLAGCGARQSIFDPKGEAADKINTLQTPVFIAAGVVGVIVFVAVAGVMWRFRDRPGRVIPSQSHGKKAVVFCTYALDPGKTLAKFSAVLAERGADVLGGMAIRRHDLADGADEFVDRVMQLTSA